MRRDGPYEKGRSLTRRAGVPYGSLQNVPSQRRTTKRLTGRLALTDPYETAGPLREGPLRDGKVPYGGPKGFTGKEGPKGPLREGAFTGKFFTGSQGTLTGCFASSITREPKIQNPRMERVNFKT